MYHYSSLSITVISLLLLVTWRWDSVLTAGTSYCSCYSFKTTIKNDWENSNQYCQQNGGNLVSMETEEEYQFINSTIQSLNVGKNEWYIGLKRTYPRDRRYWHWISRQGMTNKLKWVPGEPRDDDGDCVKMIKHYRGLGTLDDVKCSTRSLMFICEYKTVSPCPSTTKQWCPPNHKLLTTSTKKIVTTTSLPAARETPGLSSTTTTTTSTTSSRKAPISPLTNIKSTVFPSSAETGKQTEAVIHATSKPATAHASSAIIENERATGSTTRIGGENPQSRSSASNPFPLVIVTVALSVVLAVSVCLLVFVCYWKRRNRGGKNKNPKSETTSLPHDAIEHSSNNNQSSEGGDLADGVQLFHQSGGDPYVAYAVIHNNLTTQQTNGPAGSTEPAYTSVEDEKMIKRFSQKSIPNAAIPSTTINAENSGNSVGTGKSNTEVLYASVNNSKKNNKKKSKKGKAQAEDAVYAEVGSKDNSEKQQPYQITYAELADLNLNAPTDAVKPAPYQPSEYAVIIGQKQQP